MAQKYFIEWQTIQFNTLEMKHTNEKINHTIYCHAHGRGQLTCLNFSSTDNISQSPYPPYLRVHEPLLTFSSLPLKVLRHLLQLPPNLRRETLLYPQAHPGKQLFTIAINNNWNKYLEIKQCLQRCRKNINTYQIWHGIPQNGCHPTNLLQLLSRNMHCTEYVH